MKTNNIELIFVENETSVKKDDKNKMIFVKPGNKIEKVVIIHDDGKNYVYIVNNKVIDDLLEEKKLSGNHNLTDINDTTKEEIINKVALSLGHYLKIMRDFFDEMYDSLNDYRRANSDKLEDDDKKSLKSMAITMSNYAESLNTQAVTLMLEVSEESVFNIKKVTSVLKETISKIENLKKVFNIAASVISLGTAIITKDLGAIKTSLENLFKIVKDS